MKEEYYLAARIVLDVFIISTLKYIFFTTKRIKKKMKKHALMVCLVVMALNIVGIYRNSYTVWAYSDLTSYIWLFTDIVQLIYCTWIYFIILHNEHFNLNFTYKAVMFVLCALIGLANIYNFIINFWWFNYEPFLIFVFWFVNNGAMIAFAASGCYILVRPGKYDRAN